MSTAGSRSRSRRCLPTTPPARSRRPRELHARAQRPNLFIKIPGTPEGLPAIEESIFAGVPVNVTLLFSREHYLAAAEAYMRGIERRIAAGLDPKVGSVASLFVSRWDVAVNGQGAGSAAQSAWHRRGHAHLQSLPRSARLDALAAAASTPARGRSACCGPAPAPRIRATGRPLCRGAGRAAYRQHDAGEDAACLRRSRRRRRADAA